MKTKEQNDQEQRERMMIAAAKSQGKSISYIDTDGCEVTVTPSGHSFYNMADWY